MTKKEKHQLMEIFSSLTNCKAELETYKRNDWLKDTGALICCNDALLKVRDMIYGKR